MNVRRKTTKICLKISNILPFTHIFKKNSVNLQRIIINKYRNARDKAKYEQDKKARENIFRMRKYFNY